MITDAYVVLLFAVAGCRRAVGVQVTGRPQHAARYEVEIAGIFDGAVVVPQGGAEHSGFLRAIFVGPNDDISCVIFFGSLLTPSESM